MPEASLYKIDVLLRNIAFRQLQNQQLLQNLRNIKLKMKSEVFDMRTEFKFQILYKKIKYIVRFVCSIISFLFLIAGLESQVQDSKDLYWF